MLLRAASGVFKDLKELLYVGPFFAVTTAVALDTVASSRRAGRLAAAAVSVGLDGFGLAEYLEYFELHTRLAGLP